MSAGNNGGVAQLAGQVVPNVVSNEKTTKKQRVETITAERLAQLAGWSRSKAYRWFRSNNEHLVIVPAAGGPGGERRELPVAFLPPDVHSHLRDDAPTKHPRELDLDDAATIETWTKEDRLEGFKRLDAVRTWRRYLDSFKGSKPPGGKTVAAKRFAHARGFSPATLRRWISSYQKHGVEALRPSHGQRKGKRFALSIEDQVFCVELYCHDEHPSIKPAAVCEAYKWRCIAEGRKPAAENTVRALLADDKVQKRKYAVLHGVRKMLETYGPYTLRTTDGIMPGDFYVSDHRQHDAACVWDDNRIVYPWFTGIQDFATRAIVGQVITDNPNSDTIRLALTRAFRDFGVCKSFHRDNGLDYASIMIAEICRRLDIREIAAIPFNARAKIIERFNGFLSSRSDRGSKGYRGHNPVARPSNSETLVAKTKKAIAEGRPVGLAHGTLPTRAEFEKSFVEFIAYYNARPSKSEMLDGQAPNAVWEAHAHAPLKRLTHEQMRFLLMRDDRKKVRPGGFVRLSIAGEKLYYYADLLLTDYVGLKVNIQYHPDDLDVIYISDAETDEALCVATRETKIPGVTDDYKLVERALKEQGRRKKKFKEAVLKVDELAEEIVAGIKPHELQGRPDPDTVPPGPDLSKHAVEMVHTGDAKRAKEFTEMVANLDVVEPELADADARSRQLLRDVGKGKQIQGDSAAKKFDFAAIYRAERDATKPKNGE